MHPTGAIFTRSGQTVVPEGEFEAYHSPSPLFPILKCLEGTERSHVLESGKTEQGTAFSLVMAPRSMRESPISLKYPLSFWFFVSLPFPAQPFDTADLKFGLQHPGASSQTCLGHFCTQASSAGTPGHLPGPRAFEEHLLHQNT